MDCKKRNILNSCSCKRELMWFTKGDTQLELQKWEQEVVSLGCGHCGARSHAAHCFCIGGLQDHCDPLAAAGILTEI